MKVGIIGSGYDMLPIWQMINTFEHEYTYFVDYPHWPRSERSYEQCITGIDSMIHLGKKQGIEYFIVPPLYEQEIISRGDETIIPLFQEFFRESLTQSRIGKIGILAVNDDKKVQELCYNYTKKYSLTASQKQTRRFHNPFAIRTKSIRMAPFFLTSYAKSDWMVRKTLKHDLRYFSDADVDTIIPIDRSFLYYEKIITHTLNTRRYRFCGGIILSTVMEKYLGQGQEQYTCSIVSTQNKLPFLQEKKWTMVLSKGGAVSIDCNTVSSFLDVQS